MPKTEQNWAGILKWGFFIVLLAAVITGAGRALCSKPPEPREPSEIEAELEREGYMIAKPRKTPMLPETIPGTKPAVQGQGEVARPGPEPWPDTLAVELEILEANGEPWAKVTVEGQPVKWTALARFEGWPAPEGPSPISITGGYAITEAHPWQAGIAWEPIRPGGDRYRLGLEGVAATDLSWGSLGIRGSARLGPVSLGAGLGWAIGEDPGIRPSISAGIAVDF